MKTAFSSCPLCNGGFALYKSADATKHPFYHSDLPPVIHWMKCDACGHIFTSTYWTDEAWKLIFAKSHSYQTANLGDAAVQRLISARIIEKVQSFLGRTGSWLDVGCGNGSLIFTADEFGFDARGIDLRKDAVNAVMELGYIALCETIEHTAERSLIKFDVVSMADLLEHTPFPKVTLAAAKHALGDDGLLYVSCPNSDTATWKMFGDDNPYWTEIEHFHNFSRARLTELLRECGFEVLHYGVSERYMSGMELICRVKS